MPAQCWWAPPSSTGSFPPFTEATGWIEPFRVLNTRLSQWGETATEGGISTDTVPFALMLTSLAWLIGYLSAWAAFRRRSVWLSVVPGRLGDVFQPELPARAVQLPDVRLLGLRHAPHRQDELSEPGGGLDQGGSVDIAGLRAAGALRGSWYILAVLVIAFLLPSRPWQSPWLDAAWEWTRSPLDTLENDLDRLFAALPDRKGGLNLNFGSHLPFQGSISLSDEPLFLLESPRPAYLRARAYPVYTAQGWTTGKVDNITFEDDLPVEPASCISGAAGTGAQHSAALQHGHHARFQPAAALRGRG